MPYRIHKKRKLVEVSGTVDLSVIVDKVKGHGGPKGWFLRTVLTPQQINDVAEAICFGEDDEDVAENAEMRLIGFRQPSEHQVFNENPLIRIPGGDDDSET